MSRYPIVKYVIVFVLGLIFHHFFYSSTTIYLLLISGMIVLMVSLYLLRYYIHSYYLTIAKFIFIFLIGSLHGSIFSLRTEYPFESPKIRNAKVEGEVSHIYLVSENKLTLELTVDSVNDSLLLNSNNSIFLCNIWYDTSNVLHKLYQSLRIGNYIILEGTVAEPKNRRNPGEFDYQKYLHTRGISGTINCYSPQKIKIVDSTYTYHTNVILDIRKAIYNNIHQIHSSSSSALLKGVLLADRSDIDYNIKQSFIDSGVIHVLAVSGLHVGFISIIFYLILGRFNIRLKYIGVIVGLLIFLVITGGHASVFRASTMAIIYLVAKLFNRSTNGINSISIAALIILVLKPEELFNPGFQLSFSAVLSILILYPRLSDKLINLRINGTIKKILLFLIVSLSAQLGTIPFTVIYFNKLSLVSLFANLFVIPTIGIIIALGIFTVIVSASSVWTSSFFAAANDLIVQVLYNIIEFTSKFQLSYIDVINFSLLDSLFYYLFVSIAVFVVTKFKNKLVIMICLPIIYFSFLNFISLDDECLLPEGKLSIMMLDVGQGDAIYINFPNGKNAIIDAGNSTHYFDNGERVILPILKLLKKDRIDYGFVSHIDSDHLGGFFTLFEKGIVDIIYKPLDEVSRKDSLFEEYLSSKEINFQYYSNSTLDVGNCMLYILNDTSSNISDEFDTNNKSGIIKIVHGDNSFLFVGDAGMKAELFLLDRYKEFLNSDVLKVGHHGSKTSSTEELLDAVDPSIALISAGIMNIFNHPSQIVLERLSERDVSIMRTDLEGAVILCSNGEEINKINWRE